MVSSAFAPKKQTSTANFADTAWFPEEVPDASAIRSVVFVGSWLGAGLQ